MSMEISNGYGSYTNLHTGKTENSKVEKELKKTDGTKDTDSANQTTRDYLNDLRKKYSDINITVVDFKSEKQELFYMLGCSGGNNVAISSAMVEKMAKDPVTAEKYEKIIADIPNVSKEAKEKIEADPGSKYIASGVKIDKNGKVTYWSVSQKTTEGPGSDQKEKLQKQLEEKRAEKKKQEKAEAKKKEKQKEQAALEEKRSERKAEEKERMELLLAKGEQPEVMLENIGKGDGNVIFSDAVRGIEAGNRINLSV